MLKSIQLAIIQVFSSLTDKNSANGGHFEFPSKDEEKG
jgi:hypothetical protein